jgi:hypothetical protein
MSFISNNAQISKKLKETEKPQKEKTKTKTKKVKKKRKENEPAHTPRLGVRRLGHAYQGGV